MAQWAPSLKANPSLEASSPPGDPSPDPTTEGESRGGDSSSKLGSKDGPPPIAEPSGVKPSVGSPKTDVNSQVIVVVGNGHGMDWVGVGHLGWPAIGWGAVIVDGVGSSHEGEEGNGNNGLVHVGLKGLD